MSKVCRSNCTDASIEGACLVTLDRPRPPRSSHDKAKARESKGSSIEKNCAALYSEFGVSTCGVCKGHSGRRAIVVGCLDSRGSPAQWRWLLASKFNTACFHAVKDVPYPRCIL